MRKLRFVSMMFALAVCTSAQAHVYQTSPCGFGNFYFSQVYQKHFTALALEVAYLEHMAEEGYASCIIKDDGSPDLRSCGGVDEAKFVLRHTQQICEIASANAGIPLVHDFSTTPFLGVDGEAHHKYRFAYGLLVSCGTCTPTPTE